MGPGTQGVPLHFCLKSIWTNYYLISPVTNRSELGQITTRIKEKSKMLLAGDIGGTKTNLAVFSHETGWRLPIAESTFPSASYPSLEALVREFLSQHNFSIDHASFGVAG